MRFSGDLFDGLKQGTGLWTNLQPVLRDALCGLIQEVTFLRSKSEQLEAELSRVAAASQRVKPVRKRHGQVWEDTPTQPCSRCAELQRRIDKLDNHKCERSELMLLRDKLDNLSTKVQAGQRTRGGSEDHGTSPELCTPQQSFPRLDRPGAEMVQVRFMEKLAALEARFERLEALCQGRASKLSVVRAISQKLDIKTFSGELSRVLQRVTNSEEALSKLEGRTQKVGDFPHHSSEAFREVVLRRLSLLEEETERIRAKSRSIAETTNAQSETWLRDLGECTQALQEASRGHHEAATLAIAEMSAKLDSRTKELHRQVHRNHESIEDWKSTAEKQLRDAKALKEEQSRRQQAIEVAVRELENLKPQIAFLELRVKSNMEDVANGLKRQCTSSEYAELAKTVQGTVRSNGVNEERIARLEADLATLGTELRITAPAMMKPIQGQMEAQGNILEELECRTERLEKDCRSRIVAALEIVVEQVNDLRVRIKERDNELTVLAGRTRALEDETPPAMRRGAGVENTHSPAYDPTRERKLDLLHRISASVHAKYSHTRKV